MASSLIRYNYPSLSLSLSPCPQPPDLRGRYGALQTHHTAPSVGWKSHFSLSVYLQSMSHMEKWRGSSFDAINFNISVPWCKVSEHTLYSGAKQDSLSPLGTFKADSGSCRSVTKWHQAPKGRLTHRILGEQPTARQKEALLAETCDMTVI